MKRMRKATLVLRDQVEQVFAERDILAFIDNPFVVSLLRQLGGGGAAGLTLSPAY